MIIVILLLAASLFTAEKAQDFQLENIKGKMVKLSDFQKEGLVILDFWASWCVPCKKALPELNKLHKQYENVNVVTICTDKPRTQPKAIAEVKSHKYEFHTLLDSKKIVQKQYNIINIPVTIIIAPDGEILLEHTGFKRGDEKHYKEVIENWLKSLPQSDKKIEESE
jgi:peroxiredoxin